MKNTNLIQADVTKSIKMKKAALAVSTADAVNHLSSIEDIKLFFNNVYQGLKKDGIFIFDMNTQLGAKVNCSHITTSTKHYIAIREGFFDEINNIGYTRFQGAYQKRGTNYYVRYDSTIYNYIYPISKIVDLLKKVGFKAINLHNEYTSEKYDEEWTERVLFICNK
ncbi:class I SAM-dependent methyltransferase [Lactobacillus taiwanensis]|uniref:hypothetical protein n=1 Tax=Lactobacillus taiwanensis TaxID=508451 RepID=UPI000B97DD51|nr:hypothetical protein [Lactobacillus taiwanensis]OYR94734.1 hypothetical protein CBF51_10175 [Lactobacillus taiwanensis]OYR99768.1 hypothetical protein CBF61_08485 [Lactobacillus taiwanensis]OYS12917.1 hypothetical protein CBF69_09950 [Lactobacillus taiwanensis]OYS30360.1 hypothetical protein CBF75_08135 [Lactobacillus taiwanensis]OYS31497.1 hypothetical protein CBF78_08770 [Lactobacillus taiwanensis]